jgi:hypothetical protein
MMTDEKEQQPLLEAISGDARVAAASSKAILRILSTPNESTKLDILIESFQSLELRLQAHAIALEKNTTAAQQLAALLIAAMEA